MTNLIPFQFDTAAVRVITTESGEILFVAKDVATALGYADAAQAVKDHCKKAVNYTNGDKTVINEIKELHRTKSLVIPESDVYRLVMRSKLETAEKFQDWVCEEVLPSIRKTGSYAKPELPDYLNPVTEPIPYEKHLERRNALLDALKRIEQEPVTIQLTAEKVRALLNTEPTILPQTQVQASIPTIDENLNSDKQLATRLEFEAVLARFLEGKKSAKELRCIYRKQFAKTGKIPNMVQGIETRGVDYSVSDEILKRFEELVILSTDQTKPATFIALKQRTVTLFHSVLEDEFKQKIPLHSLYWYRDHSAPHLKQHFPKSAVKTAKAGV